MEVTRRWLEVKANCLTLMHTNDFKKKEVTRQILCIIYKEIILLKQFIQLNHLANRRLGNKVKLYTKDIKVNFQVPQIKKYYKKTYN